MSQQEPAQLNRLDLAKQIKLADLMRADYTESGLNDPAYAARATEKIGFTVTTANIFNMRNSLGMPANQPKVRRGDADGLEARVAALEATVARLVQQLGGLQ